MSGLSSGWTVVEKVSTQFGGFDWRSRVGRMSVRYVDLMFALSGVVWSWGDL